MARPPLENLGDLFPDDDFRFHMAVHRGSAQRYFQPTDDHEALVAERRRWLRADPDAHAAFVPECAPLLNECTALAESWGLVSKAEQATLRAQPGADQCRRLGEILEPDFLLLKADTRGAPRLLGGCVVFPSSWSLEEKMGKPLDLVHAPVPALNAQLARSIQSFLIKLSPGEGWLRHNWGLSRSPELNQHPKRGLARLDAGVAATEVWLRVEHQAIAALPQSGGVLFGIRIENHPLAEVAADPIAAQRLARALQTMPPEIARYKGLAGAREEIVEFLRKSGPSRPAA